MIELIVLLIMLFFLLLSVVVFMTVALDGPPYRFQGFKEKYWQWPGKLDYWLFNKVDDIYVNFRKRR